MIDFENESLREQMEISLHTLLTKKSWTRCEVTKLLMLFDEALPIDWENFKEFPYWDLAVHDDTEYFLVICAALTTVTLRSHQAATKLMSQRIRETIEAESRTGESSALKLPFGVVVKFKASSLPDREEKKP